MTNDDGIQFTSKMVTLTSLMNAHTHTRKMFIAEKKEVLSSSSCQLNGRDTEPSEEEIEMKCEPCNSLAFVLRYL